MQYGSQDIAAGPLKLAPGSQLVITLAAVRGSVRGRVDFGTEDPLEDTEITLSPITPIAGLSLDRFFTTRTDNQGAFQFTGLAPGRYRVFAWQEHTLYATLPPFLDLLAASTVTVENGPAPDIKIGITTALQVEEAKARF